MKQWPEITKNDKSVSMPVKAAVVKKILCYVGIHEKYMELGERQEIITKCRRCNKVLKVN